MPQRDLNFRVQKWPVAGVFRISRSALTEIITLIVEISENGQTGRGECRPYARYDETPESVVAEIQSIRTDIENGISVQELQSLMPAGAARNALDCALWDLKSRQTKKPVWDLLDCPQPDARETAFTLSVDTPEKMAKAALAAAGYPLLKAKMSDWSGITAVEKIIDARPDAQIIVDANEAFDQSDMARLLKHLNKPQIVLIEQPVPAGNENFSENLIAHAPPICADESIHSVNDLDRLWDAGYRAVNIKLDKTGGLTEAHSLIKTAKTKGFVIMAGCMVASSLAMAPMIMLESYADFIDLDGPLLLSDDIEHGLKYEGALVHPPQRNLWGY